MLLPDVGVPLRRLSVRSDNAGASPAWHLDWVAVTAAINDGPPPHHHYKQQQQRMVGQKVEGRTWWFVAQRWLDETRGLEVQLDAQDAPPVAAADQQLYTLSAHTSDIRGAGTDATVFVQMFGEQACSGPCALLSPVHRNSMAAAQSPPAAPAAFSRGSVDTFNLRMPHLGALQQLRVWTDGRGERGANWHLDFIAVREGERGPVWYFPLHSWLAGGLEHAVSLTATTRNPMDSLKQYRVVVRTSDVAGAGTDAEPWVELLSSSPGSSSTHATSSGRRVLRGGGGNGSGRGGAGSSSSSGAAFSVGSVDPFEVVCRDLGDLTECVVGHDGLGAHPAWHLEQVG